jgi:ArsR family transcriptional regulator
MSASPRDPSELFRAFADPTRLRILSLLQEEKEICVCDLCEVLDEIQPKVSRHLATLRRVGLVHARRDGKWMLYSLAEPTPLHRTLLRCVRSCFRGFAVLADDRRRLRARELRLRCG